MLYCFNFKRKFITFTYIQDRRERKGPAINSRGSCSRKGPGLFFQITIQLIDLIISLIFIFIYLPDPQSRLDSTVCSLTVISNVAAFQVKPNGFLWFIWPFSTTVKSTKRQKSRGRNSSFYIKECYCYCEE